MTSHIVNNFLLFILFNGIRFVSWFINDFLFFPCDFFLFFSFHFKLISLYITGLQGYHIICPREGLTFIQSSETIGLWRNAFSRPGIRLRLRCYQTLTMNSSPMEINPLDFPIFNISWISAMTSIVCSSAHYIYNSN